MLRIKRPFSDISFGMPIAFVVLRNRLIKRKEYNLPKSISTCWAFIRRHIGHQEEPRDLGQRKQDTVSGQIFAAIGTKVGRTNNGY